jgi:hyperosmotically inducible protein
MKTVNHLGVLASTLVTLVVPAGLYASAGDTSTAPPSLEERVRHELASLPYYNVFDNLAYRVDNGKVILFGEVTEPVTKEDAERSVKHLEGVTSVASQIEVLPWSTFDNRIRMNAYRAIYGYGPLQHYGVGSLRSIHIIVKNGNITLAGVVQNETDRNLAYVRANGVPGVFSVTNDLQVAR